MDALRGRALRFSVAVAVALVFVFGTATSVRADSGGFYCGYGAASLTYDCESGSWSYQFGEGGRCTIQVDNPQGCYVYLDSEPPWRWSTATFYVNGEVDYVVFEAFPDIN